jgi:hypothetical protein
MGYRPGGPIAIVFPIFGSGGGLAEADSPGPVAVIFHNGAIDDSVTFTIANPSTGIYVASSTIPSGYAAGDTIAVLVTAAVSGVDLAQTYVNGVIDSPTVTLSSGSIAAIFSQVVLGSFTFTQLLQGISAVLFAKNSGMATPVNTFRDILDTKNVIIATTDSNGDRTVINFTPLATYHRPSA